MLKYLVVNKKITISNYTAHDVVINIRLTIRSGETAYFGKDGDAQSLANIGYRESPVMLIVGETKTVDTPAIGITTGDAKGRLKLRWGPDNVTQVAYFGANSLVAVGNVNIKNTTGAPLTINDFVTIQAGKSAPFGRSEDEMGIRDISYRDQKLVIIGYTVHTDAGTITVMDSQSNDPGRLKLQWGPNACTQVAYFAPAN